MKTREIMTPAVRCVRPTDTLNLAATIMRDHGVGAVPVCDENKILSGFLTDRDIVVRAIAQGLDPNRTTAEEIMSSSAIFTYDDEDVNDSAHLMEEYQIRRLPVLNHHRQLVGIVSLADVARKGDPELSGEVLREVSKPGPGETENPANL